MHISKDSKISFSLILGLVSGCSTSHGPLSANGDENIDRIPASVELAGPNCAQFDAYSGEAKAKEFFKRHTASILEVTSKRKNEFNSENIELDIATTNFQNQRQNYVKAFIGNGVMEGMSDAMATFATVKFLAPDVDPKVALAYNFARFKSGLLLPKLDPKKIGSTSLRPTFQNYCEIVDEPNPPAKKVHALGSFAKARMNIYPELLEIDETGKTIAKVNNPWTGLFDPKENEGGIPLFLRFSIANPILHTLKATVPVEVKKKNGVIVAKIEVKDLLLEFIPGLGLKFLIDGKRSIDLVAMESLAGQGSDQNWFKYTFSPDFSGHAPLNFITSKGQELKTMTDRYNINPVNSLVMQQVASRFAMVIPQVMNVPMKDIKAHSNRGPHSFVISIEKMAQFTKSGRLIADDQQKRPWRLLFKPALDSGSLMQQPQRLAKVVDSTPYEPQKLELDFRSKLSYLEYGDRVFYVVGETEDRSEDGTIVADKKRQYIIGEIVLESSVVPSTFADRMYFIQHRLDMGRVQGQSVVEPRL